MDVVAPRVRCSLSVRGVTRSFGGRVVLRDVSFQAGPGELVAIAGANGSGKTTLLRIVAGLVTPEAGIVAFDGSSTKACGWAPAGDRAVHWQLSARENLRFVARLAGRRRDDATVDIAIDTLGVGPFVDRPLGRCSTGQRRRVMLAQAFVAADAVVVLDEPFEDLDADGVADVRGLLESWRAAGGIVVAATPDPTELPDGSVIVHLGASG